MTETSRQTAHAIAAEIGEAIGENTRAAGENVNRARNLSSLAAAAALRAAFLEQYIGEASKTATMRAEGVHEHEATKHLARKDQDESRAGII